jgi:hypothetical protein
MTPPQQQRSESAENGGAFACTEVRGQSGNGEMDETGTGRGHP